MKKETWFFTFGMNHLHPEYGFSMGHYFVEVHGTFSEAREKMVEKYGTKWAFQYKRAEFEPAYCELGCYEVIK